MHDEIPSTPRAEQTVTVRFIPQGSVSTVKRPKNVRQLLQRFLMHFLRLQTQVRDIHVPRHGVKVVKTPSVIKTFAVQKGMCRWSDPKIFFIVPIF